MRTAVGLWHQQVDVLADDFRGAETEYLLGSAIESFHAPVRIDDDDRIDRCVEQGTQILRRRGVLAPGWRRIGHGTQCRLCDNLRLLGIYRSWVRSVRMFSGTATRQHAAHFPVRRTDASE
jgi:hypothetical protein